MTQLPMTRLPMTQLPMTRLPPTLAARERSSPRERGVLR
jgi:hypothetical protein